MDNVLIHDCLARLSRRAIFLLMLLPFHGHTAEQAHEAHHAKSQQAHVRVLASSCAACHGTSGNSVGGTPVLAGLDSYYFRKQMLAFRTGGRASTVMHHHARGLTLEEIDQLSQYFSMQPRRPALQPSPPPR